MATFQGLLRNMFRVALLVVVLFPISHGLRSSSILSKFLHKILKEATAAAANHSGAQIFSNYRNAFPSPTTTNSHPAKNPFVQNLCARCSSAATYRDKQQNPKVEIRWRTPFIYKSNLFFSSSVLRLAVFLPADSHCCQLI